MQLNYHRNEKTKPRIVCNSISNCTENYLVSIESTTARITVAKVNLGSPMFNGRIDENSALVTKLRRIRAVETIYRSLLTSVSTEFIHT